MYSSQTSRAQQFVYGLQRVCENEKKPQVSPLRYAPVEMTIQWVDEILCLQEKIKKPSCKEIVISTGA